MPKCAPQLAYADMDVLRRTARIMGNLSAAQQALDEFAKRKEAGADPVILQTPGHLLVVDRSDLLEARNVG